MMLTTETDTMSDTAPLPCVCDDGSFCYPCDLRAQRLAFRRVCDLLLAPYGADTDDWSLRWVKWDDASDDGKCPHEVVAQVVDEMARSHQLAGE